ncbi:MAG: ATP-dependent zinc metalloprotease FtsH [Candidatus Eremiobacteraeota bacterium]|nr:ATP-dependent zinc metalloprotease FtsH [Candidatus Eremiobacteraeota bacterium]
MSKHLRSVLLIILAVVAVFIIVERFVQPSEGSTRLDYGAFYQKLEAGQIQEFHAVGLSATGTLTNGTKYTVSIPNTDQAFVDEVNKRVKSGQISFDQQSNTGLFSNLISLAPLAITVLLLFFLLRQAQSGGSQALSFGRSRAKMLSENRPKVTFADVAGVDEAKEELAEIVDFLKYPKKYQSLGARIPKGVLLLGPPGTGKTLLARAIAGEAGVPFLSISGSDFVEMFVGVGASRVRDLFDQAKKSAPCIVFIDEIDAVGRQRGAGLGGGHDEREQTLNQLLVEMDGFDPNTGVILIAATNRPDVLDPALLRPGRFDRQIVVDRADVRGRAQILAVHARNKPLSKEISLETLAKRTPGFSGADLENLLNEAALLAARQNKSVIEMSDCEEAIDRVIAGPERRSRIISQKEKEIVAYHESGHAVVGGMLPNANPVHKVTIISRGMALGVTMQLPTEDRYLMTRAEIIDQITGLLGGRVAEEIQFKEVTTGASNDFEKATELARRMVTQYGMSSELGTVQYGRGNHQVFLGRDLGEDRNYSEEIASKIDGQVRQIIDDCYKIARGILEANWVKVQRMVDSLLEHETVEAEEVQAILADAPYPRPVETAEAPVDLPAAAATPVENEPVQDKPKRLPPNISPEPA